MTGPLTQIGRDWRPQSFGRRSFRDVDDPLIEPLWSGTRVLARVKRGVVALVDAAGDEQAAAAIAAALGEALQADAAIVDGYLTWEAAGTGEGVATIDTEPSKGNIARQMFLGGAGASVDRRAELARLEERRLAPPADAESVVFVAVDLLALDGDDLLDVPLLERKRLLDAILVEGELVRLGIHVRPPVDPWIPTWKALGFRGLVYKAANSRYRPGAENDGWATAPMPRR